MSDMPIPQVVAIVVVLIGAVVATWMLIRDARGRSRVVGVIGTVLVLVATVGDLSYRYWLGALLSDASDATLIKTLAGELVIQGVLTALGLAMLTYAVIVSGRLRTT